MAYMSELHPEVYLTPPRPGGMAKIVTPGSFRKQRSSISGKSSKATSRSVTMKSSYSGKGSLRSYQDRSSLGGVSGMTGFSSMKSGISGFDSSFLTSTPDKISREHRIQQVLHSSQWMPVDDDQDVLRCSDPVGSVLMILSITISTIMLMAAHHHDINKDHLRWAMSYLECVKDEYGVPPPNVRGILNNIKLIDDTLESFLESEDDAGGMLDAATGPVEVETGNTKPETITE